MAFKNELFNFIHNDRIINDSKTTFCLSDKDQKSDNITVLAKVQRNTFLHY